MKSLKDILNESLLNESLLNKSLLNESLLDDEDELFDRNDKTLIELWIKENYKIRGVLKIHEDKHGFVVDSGANVEVANKDIKSLTNGMFRWGEITGSFNCKNCVNLTSLEGAPQQVSSFFDCYGCIGLMTLEGAPQQVGGWFNCENCVNLTSLKGAPSKCKWYNCSKCTKLISLKGAPKK